MKKNLWISIAMTVVTTVVFGLMYPMIVTGLAQVIFPHKANGQLIVKDGRFLVCQRTRHQTMPLKWEFPGGKIEEGEQPRDAMHRFFTFEHKVLLVVGQEVRPALPVGDQTQRRFDKPPPVLATPAK